MAITRSTMVDDDGSGTTGTILNNAWLQDIYGRIDGIPAQAWTPIDVSGAGLSFVVTSAWYVQIGQTVTINVNMQMPVNSNGATAQIGGLPFPGAGANGLYSVYGVQNIYHIQAATTVILPLNATTGAGLSNANLSGQSLVLAGTYIRPA